MPAELSTRSPPTPSLDFEARFERGGEARFGISAVMCGVLAVSGDSSNGSTGRPATAFLQARRDQEAAGGGTGLQFVPWEDRADCDEEAVGLPWPQMAIEKLLISKIRIHCVTNVNASLRPAPTEVRREYSLRGQPAPRGAWTSPQTPCSQGVCCHRPTTIVGAKRQDSSYCQLLI